MVFAEINTFKNQKNQEGEQAILPTIILQLKTILCNNIFLHEKTGFQIFARRSFICREMPLSPRQYSSRILNAISKGWPLSA